MIRRSIVLSVILASLVPGFAFAEPIYVMRPQSAIGKASAVLPNDAFAASPSTPPSDGSDTPPDKDDVYDWQSDSFSAGWHTEYIKVTISRNQQFDMPLDTGGYVHELDDPDGHNNCYLQSSSSSSDPYGQGIMRPFQSPYAVNTLQVNFERAGRFGVDITCNYRDGKSLWNRSFDFTVVDGNVTQTVEKIAR